VNNRFSGRRALLVEDEPIVAWLLKDMLVDLGCSVVGPAADVNQALAMIDAQSIDVAVLDVNLRANELSHRRCACRARCALRLFDRL
jgi:CheY-like chemotaxis protein